MLKASLPSPSLFILEYADCPALENNAVARCAGSWDKVYRASMEKSKSVVLAERDAGKAFRQAMPNLCGYENICDYIACTSFGMLVGAIEEKQGNRFLYAANVALAAFAKSKTQPRFVS